MNCPKCLTKENVIRKKRTKLQRLVIGSKLFKCKNCYSSFIWLGFLKNNILLKVGVSDKILHET